MPVPFFRWSLEEAPRPAHIVAAMLGMTVPILAGVLLGRTEAGMAAGMGGLALGGGAQGATVSAQAKRLGLAIGVGSAALLVGTLLGQAPVLTLIGLPAVGMLAALIGSISMPLVRLSAQFVIFTAIATHLGAQHAPVIGSTILFATGAAWTAGVFLVLTRVLGEAADDGPAQPGQTANPAAKRPSASAHLKRWRASLRTVSGWQFAIRLGSCLACAEVAAWYWPLHHAYWIALTVVITLERRLPAPPVRVLERLAGTAAGVLLAGLLLLGSPPIWALIGMVAILAGARAFLRTVNYTAYAAIMTPLILILLDFDQMPTVDILVDRLLATAAGCGITLLVGYLAWRGYRPAPKAGT